MSFDTMRATSTCYRYRGIVVKRIFTDWIIIRNVRSHTFRNRCERYGFCCVTKLRNGLFGLCWKY